jgi:hypothetical protein
MAESGVRGAITARDRKQNERHRAASCNVIKLPKSRR